jgi:hypothetical protein
MLCWGKQNQEKPRMGAIDTYLGNNAKYAADFTRRNLPART